MSTINIDLADHVNHVVRIELHDVVTEADAFGALYELIQLCLRKVPSGDSLLLVEQDLNNLGWYYDNLDTST